MEEIKGELDDFFGRIFESPQILVMIREKEGQMAAQRKTFKVAIDLIHPVSSALRKAIADEMQDKDISSYDLAKRTGLSPTVIWKFLAGETFMSLPNIDRTWRTLFPCNLADEPARWVGLAKVEIEIQVESEAVTSGQALEALAAQSSVPGLQEPKPKRARRSRTKRVGKPKEGDAA